MCKCTCVGKCASLYVSVHDCIIRVICCATCITTRNFLQLLRQGLHPCNKKLFPSKSLANDAISHCGDSIEVKVATAVDELKEPDCGNATEETEKDAEVEKSDYIDEDTNDMDKLRLSKNRPRS